MADDKPTNEEETENDPQIVVDEDWKAQVEKEKEELQQSGESPKSEEAGGESQSDDQEPIDIPPASFTMLLSTLATQAMAGLGVFPDPMTGKPTLNRPMAKHFIDTLAMLEEKTKGNLTDDEQTQLRDSLHQLRMIYLQAPPPSSDTDSNESSAGKPSIELP